MVGQVRPRHVVVIQLVVVRDIGLEDPPVAGRQHWVATDRSGELCVESVGEAVACDGEDASHAVGRDFRRREGAAVVHAAARNGAVVPRLLAVVSPEVELAEVSVKLDLIVVPVAHAVLVGQTGQVLLVPVTLVDVLIAEAEAQPVGDRAGDAGRVVLQIVIAGLDARLTRQLGVRSTRDRVIGAADRVATVERSLRAAQDFGALDEQGVAARLGGGGGEDAVDIEGRARVGGVGVGQAADAAQRHPVQRGLVGEAGRVVGLVHHRLDADQISPRRCKGGDGHGHLLQALFPLFSGDHDLRHGAGFRRSGAPLLKPLLRRPGRVGGRAGAHSGRDARSTQTRLARRTRAGRRRGGVAVRRVGGSRQERPDQGRGHE